MKKTKKNSLLGLVLVMLLNCGSRSVSVMREECRRAYSEDLPLVIAASGVTKEEELNQAVTGLLTGYLMCLANAKTSGSNGPML
ncbi:hypothetical protein EHQ24_01485 [Leptospira noumeaensis]|uniref:Uncharacterized protein n=1 Tax=Leptospira noumeaensis TaxID=2484964 RepID=A0A4R9IHJ6_9LEPT|nr:hypothetical protein [Leptospira noumeaensis]TGK87910.1 hypothetical protein EHQ24_01485 [Leptospira noumeaensis]